MSAERKYRPQLSSLRLRSVDVEVWGKLTGQKDSSAAEDLISIQFPGQEIREEMSRSVQRVGKHQVKTVTRRVCARRVFEAYLK